MDVDDDDADDFFAFTGYEVRCPKCGRFMLERIEDFPRRPDGIIVVWCGEHGPYHFGGVCYLGPMKDLTQVSDEQRRQAGCAARELCCELVIRDTSLQTWSFLTFGV